MELDSSLKPPAEIQQPNVISNILLTGSTGFVGSFLLLELLRHSNFIIHCLVRPSREAEGLSRLQSALEKYNIWGELSQQEKARIRVVTGDFSRPQFNTSDDEYAKLQATIGTSHLLYCVTNFFVDLVYHCGAVVNHVLPYSALKAENITGTAEIIRFCVNPRSPRLNFISTTACIPEVPPNSPMQTILEYLYFLGSNNTLIRQLRVG